jgi:hypothetical protein
MRLPLIVPVLLALTLPCAARAQEGLGSVTAVDPAESLRGAMAIAEALRSRDPETREAGKLAWFAIRESLRASLPLGRPPAPDAPGLVGALGGLGRFGDRSRLPEVSIIEAGEPSIREHLLNAIAMNTSRIGYYSARAGDAGGRARLLLRYMIVGEAVALAGTAARKHDERARAWRGPDGVPLLVGDLVPLRPLPMQAPPWFRGVATRRQRGEVRGIVKQLARDVDKALDARDLRRVADLCKAAIDAVAAREEAWRIHFAMTRHTIGSIGLCALRGAAPSRARDMRTLTIDYLRGLVKHTLPYGLNVDRLAQPLHARGLGVVVNEFTDQPFLQQYRR